MPVECPFCGERHTGHCQSSNPIHITITPPPSSQATGCQHRWAWLVSGRQACGYCGVRR